MIPLFIDCSGRRIVIFGGGEVAARKAAFLHREADVLVVSRSFSGKISGLPVRQQKLDLDSAGDDEIAGVISGAFLVVAALDDPAINNRIGKLCRAEGIHFNNADGEPGDVIIPSVACGDNYTIAVSTGGKSPAISRFIREHIEVEFPAMDAMIDLQQGIRERLKEVVPSQQRRNEILRELLADADLWKTLEVDPGLARSKAFTRYLHE